MTRKHKKHDLDIEKLDVVDVLKMEIHKVEETLRKVDEFYRKDLRRMDRLSDKIAQVGGSWSFILGFFLFLGTWVVLNAVILTTGAFDPYPFILLNLFMSALASIQACQRPGAVARGPGVFCDFLHPRAVPRSRCTAQARRPQP